MAYSTGGPFNRSAQDDFMRGVREEMDRQNDYRNPGKRADRAKDVNDRIKAKSKADGLDMKVRIDTNIRDSAYPLYEIRLPRRGRLGDIRICGQDGKPITIGPTHNVREVEWPDPQDALKHFRKVARNFDILNGYGELYEPASTE
mgnify:CR=1 FL=1